MSDPTVPVDGKTLAEIFNGIPLTDQHGRPFNPSEIAGGGQALVLFGYNGCPMCQDITKTVAQLQQEMDRQGRHIPIIVVSVQPEQDRTEMRRYVGSYYTMGVRQFANETLPEGDDPRRALGEASFDRERTQPQSGRLLHVVLPQSNAQAQELQNRMAHMHHSNSPQGRQHSSFITLFDRGRAVRAYRGLPGTGDEPERYRSELATIALADAARSQQSTTPAPLTTQPQPDSNNALALNWIVPIASGLGASLLFGSGGAFSMRGILIGLATATAASFITQWATGTGSFRGSATPDATRTPAGEDTRSAHVSRAPSLSNNPVDVARAQQQADTLRVGDFMATARETTVPSTLPELPRSGRVMG